MYPSWFGERCLYTSPCYVDAGGVSVFELKCVTEECFFAAEADRRAGDQPQHAEICCVVWWQHARIHGTLHLKL